MMNEEQKAAYDTGVIAGMSVAITGMIGSSIHCAGIDTIPMLAAVLGKSFAPYIFTVERINPQDCPRNIRKFLELIKDLVADVKEKQRATESKIIPG